MEVAVDKKNVSRMILDYLRKNPDAGDNLEGITRFWLNSERIEIWPFPSGFAENTAAQKCGISFWTMRNFMVRQRF
jgi:hypothetical protein